MLTFVKLWDAYFTQVSQFKTNNIGWGIEVFSREAKQYLNLGTCQSEDFDAQNTDI